MTSASVLMNHSQNLAARVVVSVVGERIDYSALFSGLTVALHLLETVVKDITAVSHPLVHIGLPGIYQNVLVICCQLL